MNSKPEQSDGGWSAALTEAVRQAARQDQFLEVVSPEEATRRFHAHLDLSPLNAETVALATSLGRVIAADVVASSDVPPFDRAGVDGFAVRASDTIGATDAAPRRLTLNAEILACGRVPSIIVRAGSATAIATGGMVPRGADAVVMIEHTELLDASENPAIELRRAASPGQFIAYAGSDISRGETILRRGAKIGSREIGMLAACGVARVDVLRRPKVGVLSTGDELVQPGAPIRPGAIFDSNGAILAAAIAEAGGEPVVFGALPDDGAVLTKAVSQALEQCDVIVLSGGTSKGAGDLSHRVLSGLGDPGILVHGVALKPGKPICLAVAAGKPIAVLPGFPTSAIFTFHVFVAPVIRALAGLGPEAARTVEATVPVRMASELGRKEFVLVSLVSGREGLVAFPSPKGSGSVTSFSQADGFIEVEALDTVVDAGTHAQVTLIGQSARVPDLVMMGSHCVALDAVLGHLTDQGYATRTVVVGSLGGVAAARRGECDLAPVHLLDPASGIYNKYLVGPGLSLVRGWQRMQGLLYRPGDARFEGMSAEQGIAIALADTGCLMINRNAGAGTRILIDQLLRGAKPAGYGNQPRSHNAVAAAVAQGRADWGIAIEPVARMYGLGFLPVAPESYDFLLVESRRERSPVRAFLEALREPAVLDRVRVLGMNPASG